MFHKDTKKNKNLAANYDNFNFQNLPVNNTVLNGKTTAFCLGYNCRCYCQCQEHNILFLFNLQYGITEMQAQILL